MLDQTAAITEISITDLTRVTGGAALGEAKWQDIRAAAGPHCPQTVASYPTRPANRTQAVAMGQSCIAEMGAFKAGFGGGRAKIEAGIDAAFPK